MPDQTENIVTPDSEAQGANLQTPTTVVPPDVDAIVQTKISEALKPIKENLDKAYKARDEALAKAATYEKEKREAELARLTEEGKHKEVYEIKLAEERQAREAAEAKAVELTRDMTLRSELGALEFRNENAKEMAYRELVPTLVKDANGNWVHKTGISIKDAVKVFADAQDNSFLFKQKVSTGTGSTRQRPSSPAAEKTSLFAMSQDEVLKLAAEGKLPRR